MKKRTLKALSVVCILAIVMSLCPCFSVMAATDLSSLTAEVIADKQVPTAITTDLTLPEIDGKWSSSDEAVISNTGTVTRPLAKDADVTLTATPTEGAAKSFSFTVKAKNKNVVAFDNFNYSNLDNSMNQTFYTSMKNDWNISKTANTGSSIATDSTGNKYLIADYSVAATDLYWYKRFDETDMIYFDFDAWHPATGTFGPDETSSMTVQLQAYVNVKTNENEKATRLIRLVTFYNGTFYLGANGGSGRDAIIHETDLKPVSLQLDLQNKMLYGTYNNGKVLTLDCTDTTYGTPLLETRRLLDTDTITGLERLEILGYSGGASNLSLDNIVISTDAELTAEETLSLVTADSLAGKQAPTAITSNLTLPQHSGITWQSSNADVISATGVVTRPLAKDANVTLTATVNGTEMSNSFDFIVKAKTRKILFSENFNYEDLENANNSTDIFKSDAMKANKWVSSGTNGSHIRTEVDGNKYAEIGYEHGNGTNVQLQPSLNVDRLTLDFDLMVADSGVNPGDSYLIGYLKGDAAALVRLAVISGNGWFYWGNDKNSGGIKLSSTERLPVHVEIDLANKTFTGRVDGGTSAQYTGSSYSGALVAHNNDYVDGVESSTIQFNQLYQIRFQSNQNNNLLIDNVALSTDTFSVDASYASGTVSAVIGNAGTETIDATVICAGYQGDKLSVIEFQPVSLASENKNVTFTKNFAGITSYRIYLWNNMDKLIPLCVSADGIVKAE